MNSISYSLVYFEIRSLCFILLLQLHSCTDIEQDVLSECLAIQQLHTSSQHILDGKCGRSIGHHDLIAGKNNSNKYGVICVILSKDY